MVKTLQSIKKAIALLDERRASLEAIETGEPDEARVDTDWEDEAAEASQAPR